MHELLGAVRLPHGSLKSLPTALIGCSWEGSNERRSQPYLISSILKNAGPQAADSISKMEPDYEYRSSRPSSSMVRGAY